VLIDSALIKTVQAVQLNAIFFGSSGIYEMPVRDCVLSDLSNNENDRNIDLSVRYSLKNAS
jgi:hypothetical protein